MRPPIGAGSRKNIRSCLLGRNFGSKPDTVAVEADVPTPGLRKLTYPALAQEVARRLPGPRSARGIVCRLWHARSFSV